jgi:hypothetical protein
VRLGFLDRVIRFEDLATERVLLECIDASTTPEQFVQQVLGPLLAHDEQHNRDLLSTLRTYIAADYAPMVVAGFIQHGALSYTAADAAVASGRAATGGSGWSLRCA